MLRTRLPLLLLLLPALMASRCRDKDKDPVEEIQTEVLDPTVRLQVVSIDPSWGEAQKPFKATLYGAGFEDGATVNFGSITSAKATFRDANTLFVAVPPMDVGQWDITVRNPSGTEAVLRKGLTIQQAQKVATQNCDAATLSFDFDQYALRPDSRQDLDSIMECLSRRSGRIRLEGHCDSRGTTEYNLALGQRRADTVKDYLVAAGISPGRVTTVSYGEERPIATGENEDAWARNRRVELRVTE